MVNILIQVNGHKIGIVEAPVDTLRDEVMNKAEQKYDIKHRLSPMLRKVVYVPNKLMNFIG
jgi:hypothetical protein